MEPSKSSMESMVMNWSSILEKNLSAKKVFITGHTGFKGSWLTIWLQHYGCSISGYSLMPESQPNLFEMSGLASGYVNHTVGDIRDGDRLAQSMRDSEPELVLHLAAQPLVRYSYSSPAETWSTNVMGTVNVLEAVRQCPSVKAVVVVTTDKCYENKEWAWGYREIDPLGGHDPYSASKAGTELVVSSYRKSFFNQEGSPLIGSARAGNVIGGGDWSDDRLIPDAARAVATNQSLMIRNPNSTLPWQHVLDCLYGYLLLSANLLDGNQTNSRAFNFGPSSNDNLPVGDMLARLQQYWPELEWKCEKTENSSMLHEANFLYLDSMLARQQLNWEPRWTLNNALEKTASWYRYVLENPSLAKNIIQQQLEEYLNT